MEESFSPSSEQLHLHRVCWYWYNRAVNRESPLFRLYEKIYRTKGKNPDVDKWFDIDHIEDNDTCFSIHVVHGKAYPEQLAHMKNKTLIEQEQCCYAPAWSHIMWQNEINFYKWAICELYNYKD